MKKTLNGAWLFRQADKKEWLDASVPGCNFLDLMNNGVIEDPFLKLNENDVQWVGKTDFEYKRTFEITKEELEAKKIILVADMLDTVCDVSINGAFAFSAQNCFIKHECDIKHRLNITQIGRAHV